MTEHLDAILDDDYVRNIGALSIEDVRARRAEWREVETGLSYLRRLVQGRLDVLAAAREHRAEGGDGEELEDVIARLPTLLAGSTRGAGPGRLPQSIGTGEVDEDLIAELEDIIHDAGLDDLHERSDDELAAAVDILEAFEAKVSGLRKSLFTRIDAFDAELTRRYRTGEASVDSLLH